MTSGAGADEARTAHRNVERVQAALAAAGAAGTPVELAASARTAADAATALGCAVGAIASSLVFALVREPGAEPTALLILTSGAHRVDVDRVTALLGAHSVTRATPELVRAATGFPIGGVAPVGHPQPLPTLVDRALADHDVVWASAGTPHAVFATTYDELVRITGGTPADVGA